MNYKPSSTTASYMRCDHIDILSFGYFYAFWYMVAKDHWRLGGHFHATTIAREERVREWAKEERERKLPLNQMAGDMKSKIIQLSITCASIEQQYACNGSNRLIFTPFKRSAGKKNICIMKWMAWPTMWCYFRIELRCKNASLSTLLFACVCVLFFSLIKCAGLVINWMVRGHPIEWREYTYTYTFGFIHS